MVPEGTTTVAFNERVPGAHFSHVVKLESGRVNDAQMLPIWQRFLCHALVSKLPENALTEVEQRLVEIWEDHTMALAPTHNISSTLGAQMFVAQQGRHYPRPEIELED